MLSLKGGPHAIQDCEANAKEILGTTRSLRGLLFQVPKYQQASRIEVHLNPSTAQARVQLSVDPAAWFDVQLQQWSTREVLRYAQRWVNETRKKVPVEGDGPFFIEYDWAAPEGASVCRFLLEGKCDNQHCSKPPPAADSRCQERQVEDLTYSGYHAEYAHPTTYCSAKLTHRDGRAGSCGFWFEKHLMLPQLNKPGFLAMLPRAPQRELLLVVDPGSNHNLHRSNEELVDSEEAWQTFIDLAKQMGASSVALNFGLWEKAQERLKYLQSCHGHAHFYFSMDAWQKLKSSATEVKAQAWAATRIVPMFDNPQRSLLEGRNAPPPSEALQDCQKLEHVRLTAARSEVMLDTLNDLPDSIAKAVADGLAEPLQSLTSALKALQPM